MIILAFTIALLLILAAFAGAFYFVYLNNVDHTQENRATISSLQALLEASLDRRYAEKGLPPSSVNLGEQYQERKEESEKSQNRDRTRPMVMGPRERQLQESFARKAKEIEEAQIVQTASGNN